jgi:hypothetical protein
MQIERAVSTHKDHEGNPSHVVDVQIPITGRKGIVTVWGLGDAHVDSTDCCTHKLHADLERIAGEDCRVIIGGDFNNMIFARDPRFTASGLIKHLATCDDPADAVVDYNLGFLEPIADKIDLIISGNHEEEYQKRHGTNPAKRTAKELGVPYFSYYALIRYFLRDETGSGRCSRGWVHHGHGGNAPVTKGMIPLNRVATYTRFDWIMLNHLHQKTYSETTTLDDSGGFGKGRLSEVPIAGLHCGTYARNYAGETASWSAQKGHPPARLGASKLYLDWARDTQAGLFITPRVN